MPQNYDFIIKLWILLWICTRKQKFLHKFLKFPKIVIKKIVFILQNLKFGIIATSYFIIMRFCKITNFAKPQLFNQKMELFCFVFKNSIFLYKKLRLYFAKLQILSILHLMFTTFCCKTAQFTKLWLLCLDIDFWEN